jgi:malonyl-CoA O-methyltransferase
MASNLNKIKISFNKASKSYDSVANIQQEAADFLVSKIIAMYDMGPKNILDLGAGTGYVTEKLLSNFPESAFYINDLSENMLDICKVKFAQYHNFHYLPGDMLQLSANNDYYEYIVSNFAFQWLEDWRYAIKIFHAKNSRIFAFSILLDGTFDEWENMLSKYQNINLLSYPKKQDMIDFCQQITQNDQKFDFWLMDKSSSFPSALDFVRYLKLLGANSSKNGGVDIGIFRKLLTEQTESFNVTYKIFFGIFHMINK